MARQNGYEIIVGDCIEEMAKLPPNSVDAVVCDPPYGLEFMGKEWDDPKALGTKLTDPSEVGGFQDGKGGNPYSRARIRYGWDALAFQSWCRDWGEQALRIAKPGAHIIAFGGSRTHHRLMAGLEDAGWEIRDCGVWLHRQGFPKSHDVSRAIDNAAGATREVVGTKRGTTADPSTGRSDMPGKAVGVKQMGVDIPVTAPATEEAKRWDGWGTALKPSIEPWVLGRKPISESSVAANVVKWGTGALNIDGTRVPHADEADRQESEGKNRHADFGTEPGANQVYGDYSMVESKNYDASKGRWPANAVTLEDDYELRHFRAAGGQIASFNKATAKEKPWTGSSEDIDLHPTVKPIALMRHLVRLVAAPGGVVLDPFGGSGTTGEAALTEGMDAILIERDPNYVRLIEMRLGKPLQPSLL